ncbi:8390_t:CDS:10 [Paraglomus brasilianum]|uniref:8390_t:CDS:1 n=1 Tax=Paraglomus brasilianum TaxID=144538 RepID=A0A9N8Z5Q9_9GLOM|nr:8390_t:CDS:10 [Paraglomus brasilianum]
MPILPTTAPRSIHVSAKRGRPAYWAASVPLFLRRLFRFPQMVDFEFALWQMFYLCIAPRRVYRNIIYHKQTKNQWARDDPAFVVMLSFFLGLSAIAWGLVLGHGLVGILKMMTFMVFIDFVVVGMVISTLCWVFANRFLTHRHTIHAVEQTVEWQYAFDGGRTKNGHEDHGTKPEVVFYVRVFAGGGRDSVDIGREKITIIIRTKNGHEDYGTKPEMVFYVRVFAGGGRDSVGIGREKITIKLHLQVGGYISSMTAAQQFNRFVRLSHIDGTERKVPGYSQEY